MDAVAGFVGFVSAAAPGVCDSVGAGSRCVGWREADAVSS